MPDEHADDRHRRCRPVAARAADAQNWWRVAGVFRFRHAGGRGDAGYGCIGHFGIVRDGDGPGDARIDDDGRAGGATAGRGPARRSRARHDARERRGGSACPRPSGGAGPARACHMTSRPAPPPTREACSTETLPPCRPAPRPFRKSRLRPPRWRRPSPRRLPRPRRRRRGQCRCDRRDHARAGPAVAGGRRARDAGARPDGGAALRQAFGRRQEAEPGR